MQDQEDAERKGIKELHGEQSSCRASQAGLDPLPWQLWHNNLCSTAMVTTASLLHPMATAASCSKCWGVF